MSMTIEKSFFNPNGVGLKNGNFIGLPFTQESAQVVLLPVPWDVTVSYNEGTAFAPEKILEASTQLDLFDLDTKDAWKGGIFFKPVDRSILKKRDRLRNLAVQYIDFIESEGVLEKNKTMQKQLSDVNIGCEEMNEFVYAESRQLLSENKLVGLIGGDHSTPLGYLKALAEKHPQFGVLHIDAHFDLRKAYEGFIYSHASVFYNALSMGEIRSLVQIGIRDFCEEEFSCANRDERVAVFFDQHLKEERFRGVTWETQCSNIISHLPSKVYVSCDMDGFDPKLCPNTGTPVPGGFEFEQITYLIKRIVESGRHIIGFDVCETGNAEWDANVAARIIYKLCCVCNNQLV